MDVKEVQYELERVCRSCSVQELTVITQEMAIDVQADATKKNILRLIQEKFDETEADNKMELFATLVPKFPVDKQAILNKFFNNDQESDKTDSKVDSNKLEETIKKLQVQLDNLKTAKQEVVPPTTPMPAGMRMFQRDFKITGTIGTTNSKEALNYISLCSQIEEGRKKNYPDEEIAMAVRKAVCAGTPMRTYLDSSTNLKLDEVVSFVRNCLGEKSASELFQTLTNLVQNEKEDAQTFVLRALELREKVAQSSAIEGSVRFDAGAIQDAFKHAVKTGLSSDQIRLSISPLLKDPNLRDDHLLQVLNLSMSEESERLAKQKKVVKVNAATASEGSANNTLQKTVQELVTQMKFMQKEMEASRNESSNYWPQPAARQRYEWTPWDQIQQSQGNQKQRHDGHSQSQESNKRQDQSQRSTRSCKRNACDKCIQDNISGCDHCWKCGTAGHKYFQCKKKSLNRNALPAKEGSR